MKTTRLALAALALAAFAASTLPAANVSWNGNAGDGLWSSGGNWSTGAAPAADDVVTLNANATLDVDATIAELKFSGSPVLDGAGKTLTVTSGKVTGGSKPVVNCALAFPAGVAATVLPAGNYGNTLTIAGGVSGGSSVSALGGSQNYNVRFTNETVTTSALDLNVTTMFFVPLDVQSITLSDPWADGNGNGPRFIFGAGASLAVDTIVTTRQGVVTLEFSDQFAAGDVDLAIPTLHLAPGGKTALSGYLYGTKNLVTVDSFEREQGSLLRVQNMGKKGSTAVSPGVNAGYIVDGIAADANGLTPAWVHSDAYRVRKTADGALVPVVFNDYANLTESVDVSNPIGLYRLNGIASASLAGDSAVGSLLMNGSSLLPDGTMTLDLGDHDLVLGAGNLACMDSARKYVTASGSGRLVIAADEAVFTFMNESVPEIDISAPIVWEKPAGSAVEHPDFLIPSYNAVRTVFSGEDRVGDWGCFFAEGSKNLKPLVFDGPSDRTFHGTIGGRFNLEKRGTGTLTFAGPDRTRGRNIYVYEGTVSIAHDEAPAIALVTNGAVVRVEDGIAWTKTAVVRSGGVLEGSGTITSTHNHNNLFDGCVLRGGTATVPGTLSFGAQVTFPTNIVLDVGFSGDTHGQIAVGGKQTFRSNMDTEIIVRVSDVDGTANITPEATYTVYSWGGGTENWNANRITAVLENATPGRLDTSTASVAINSSAKTITVTGLRAKRGTIILLK